MLDSMDDHEVSQAAFGGIPEAKRKCNGESNRSIARIYKWNEKNVRNMAKRAENAIGIFLLNYRFSLVGVHYSRA